MKKLLIGIDVSKDSFDYCILTEDNIIHSRGVLLNDDKEVTNFCKQIKQLEKNHKVWICLEHTGYYGYLLASKFSESGFSYSLLNPLDLKLSMGLQRGKNDSIDAYRIASYALSHYHKLVAYKLPTEELQTLKVLLAQRRRLIRMSVQLQNATKGLKVASKSVDVQITIEQNKRLIISIKKEIKELDKLMLSIIKGCEELLENYNKIIKVIGVGPVTAISCIAETDNFVSFTNARKFACHCGLAPFEYQSGSSIKGKARTSKLCNKEMKGLLFQAASCAIQHDPELKYYYNRKLKEGKHKLAVLNAVASKLVLRIFAVQKREEPFIKLSA